LKPLEGTATIDRETTGREPIVLEALRRKDMVLFVLFALGMWLAGGCSVGGVMPWSLPEIEIEKLKLDFVFRLGIVEGRVR